MKELKVPYLPALDMLDISSARELMETKAARDYIACANWPEEYHYKPIAAFNIARSEKRLYIRYCVQGASIKALYTEDGSPVHRDSCVEFFMQRMNDDTYMNFEFNCIGTCDAALRRSREEKSPLSDTEYHEIKRYSSIERKPFLEQRGIFSWELTVSIPFTLMRLDPTNLPQMIPANFYKCADDTADPHFLSWNPIELKQPDFHCPQFFGMLYF